MVKPTPFFIKTENDTEMLYRLKRARNGSTGYLTYNQQVKGQGEQ